MHAQGARPDPLPDPEGGPAVADHPADYPRFSSDDPDSGDEKASVLSDSGDDAHTTTVVVAWRDPAAALQETLLNPQLVDQWRSWVQVQEHLWFANIPAAFFRHQVAWTFQPERPKLHLIYPSVLLQADDGAISCARARQMSCRPLHRTCVLGPRRGVRRVPGARRWAAATVGRERPDV